MTTPARLSVADDDLVEHVSAEGVVLEVVTRAEFRRRRLRHRCTYIAVVTSDRELVVHRRAEWKDVFPGFWDVCFGGVCAVDEPWFDGACRELAEEAGLSGDLEDLGTVHYDGGASTGSVIGRVYLLLTDHQPTCPDGEVIELDRVALVDIGTWMQDRRVCLDSREVVLPLLLRRFGLAPPSSG